MAPKSKTWFPTQDRGSTKQSSKPNTLKSPTRVEVKREPKEMDIKAFAVSDEVVIAQSFLDDAIKSKTSDVSNLNYFKLSQLTGFFDKIQNFKEDEPVETVATLYNPWHFVVIFGHLLTRKNDFIMTQCTVLVI